MNTPNINETLNLGYFTNSRKRHILSEVKARSVLTIKQTGPKIKRSKFLYEGRYFMDKVTFLRAQFTATA